MIPSKLAGSALALLIGMSSLAAQTSSTVLPDSYEQTEGETLVFWAFSPFPAQRQLLIDTRRMAPLGGRELVEIEVRRDGGNFALQGGRLRVELWLSHPASYASDASPELAANIGPDRTLFFQGFVDLPHLAGFETDPAPWGAGSVRLPGIRPFVLKGTTLCIESRTSAAQAGKPGQAPYWPIDAARGPIGESAVRGTSCLPGNAEQPAAAEAASALTGEKLVVTLQMPAIAPPVAFLLWGFDAQRWGATTLPLDLGPFGAPGCFLQQEIVGVESVLCERLPSAPYERASVEFPVPADPGLAGLRLYAQWMRFASPRATFSLSNGVEAKLAAVPRDFGYAYVVADDLSSRTGRVEHARIPILRLHHRQP